MGIEHFTVPAEVSVSIDIGSSLVNRICCHVIESIERHTGHGPRKARAGEAESAADGNPPPSVPRQAARVA